MQAADLLKYAMYLVIASALSFAIFLFLTLSMSQNAASYLTAADRAQEVASTTLSGSWKSFHKPDDQIVRNNLTQIQYEVTQKDGTETPFNNEYWNNEREGIYVDVVSGEPLFSSQDKYDSGTGWPSFTKPLVPENIIQKTDYSLVIPRTEVRSRYADSHLGHVFNDGPQPTGLRYCMNSAAMRFIPKNMLAQEGYAEYLSLFQTP